MPSFLNYHHLRYFRQIARERSLTRAADKLNLSVPALSIQLRQLEESLGQKLFDREPGGLKLTEAGRVALDYAESIGRTGEELMDVMRNRAPGAARQILRVGAVATLSRNFQLEFLKPALHRAEIEVVIRSGGQRELLAALHSHEIDLVLSNSPARRDVETPWHSHLLAEQGVGSIQVMVFRRVGSPVAWDGSQLTGLGGQPLGLRFGFAYGARQERLGVPLDDRAMSSEQLIAKLVKGRVGAILLTDEALPQVARLPPGQIEALPRLYDTLALYLIVTRDFEQRHAELVHRLWANLAVGGR